MSKQEEEVSRAIAELRSLAFKYSHKTETVENLSNSLEAAKHELNNIGGELADCHQRHKRLLGRLNDNLTIQTGPYVYQFTLGPDNVTKFVVDTAI